MDLETKLLDTEQLLQLALTWSAAILPMKDLGLTPNHESCRKYVQISTELQERGVIKKGG